MPADTDDSMEARLAELVAHLSGCTPSIARDAVDAAVAARDDDDPLAVVARALADVRRR